MGEKQNQPFQLYFHASLKVDFQGSRLTSNRGPILVRELDERLSLEKLIEEHLRDSRQGLNTQFTLTDLLRQSVYTGCGNIPHTVILRRRSRSRSLRSGQALSETKEGPLYLLENSNAEILRAVYPESNEKDPSFR